MNPKDDPEIQRIHNVIKEKLSSLDNLASWVGTLLACSKCVAEKLMEVTGVKDLDRETQYALSQIYNSTCFIAFSESRQIHLANPGMQKYFETGHVEDKMVMVIKQLYEICKEEKLL